MPDWQPVAVPVLCPRCGAYWECACREASRISEEVAIEASIRESERQGWNERNPETHFTFTKLGSLGLAKAEDAS